MKRYRVHVSCFLIIIIAFSLSMNTSKCYYSQNSLREDVNKDGVVNIKDISIVALAFGSYLGHVRWNPDGDINDDGKICIRDVILVASKFGTVDNPGTNLARNPSFEALDPIDQTRPEFWRKNQSVNDAVFLYPVTPALHGAYCVGVELSNHTDGHGAGWWQSFWGRTGSQGTTYRVRCSYLGTAKALLWTNFLNSTNFSVGTARIELPATEADWRQCEWLEFIIPDETEYMTLGIYIIDSGTLYIDLFEVIEVAE